MSVIWEKVWFNLWHYKGRTVMVVFSIAVGVFAIGTIFGMVNKLLSEMDKAHQATNPSHINITVRQLIDKETAQDLLNIPGVVGVEVYNDVTMRYKTCSECAWQSALLAMRDDYSDQQFDKLTLLEGTWPDQNTIGIERLSSPFYGLEIGDSVVFELDGTDRAFPITGVIRQPLVLPPDFGGPAYFFTNAAGMTRYGIPEGSYFLLLVQIEPYSEDYARNQASVIKDRLAKQGYGVGMVIYQEPDKHWGRDILAGINLVLRILAVVALGASVLLVINTMTAVITQETNQIGIIKAIGGTRGVVLQVYLAGVTIYGLLALLIALPLGIFAAFIGTKLLLNLMNIPIDSFLVSQEAVTLQIFAAIVAPLLAAAWPIMQGAAITVREAIATYGLGGDFGLSQMDRLVEAFGDKFLSAPLAMALGNMFRRKGRLFLTASVLVLAGTMFMMVLTLSESLILTIENELSRREFDIRIRFLDTQRAEQVLSWVNKTRGVTKAETWFSVIATVLREGEQVEDTGGLGAELFGIPDGSTAYQPHITQGRWLQLADKNERVVVISEETADFNGVTIGDRITINLGELGEEDWTIIGTYAAITPDFLATDPMYVPASSMSSGTKRVNRATLVLVTTTQQTGTYTEAVFDLLKTQFEGRQIDLDLFVSRTKSQDRLYAFNQFNIVIGLLLGLAVVMGLVGGIGLAGALSIGVMERTREIGVLRAIGATTSSILMMFVAEGIMLGVLSWAVSIPLSFIVARPVSSALGQTILQVDLDFAFSYIAIILWLLLVVLITIIASTLPAVRAAKISVRESLAYA